MASRNDVIEKMQAILAKEGQPVTTKKDCEGYLDAALAALEAVALESGPVRTAIGTFKRVERSARVARNPRTGEEVEVPAKTVLAFKAAPARTIVEEAAPAKTAKKAAPAAAKKAPVGAKKVMKKR